MNETVTEPVADGARTPRHLWIVGVLTLLWNCIGCLDFTMTETNNKAYLANMSPDQVAYFGSYPAWAVALWAVGVWGALAGSILLLLRSRLAVAAYSASLAGLVLMTINTFFLSAAPASLKTPGQMGFTAFLWAIAIAQLVYARRQAAAGVLR